MKLATIYGFFQGLNVHPINFLRPPFDSKFFLSFFFGFLYPDTWRSRNMNRLCLNILNTFFL